jgi:hypothetical protein
MTTNLYEAPEPPSGEIVKGFTEQQLAKHFLAQRDGYSIAYVLRKSAWRFMLNLCVLVFVIIGFYTVDSSILKGVLLFSIGMLIGALLRDIVWIRRVKRQWPFTRKIIDWRKVEAYAEGREPSDKDAGDPA